MLVINLLYNKFILYIINIYKNILKAALINYHFKKPSQALSAA